MLFIPEIQLKKMLDAIILYIRTDYNTVSNKDNSYLALQLKGLKIGNYDLYEQAVEVFVNRGKNHPKQLEVFHFFNAERSPIPTIHIILPDDSVGPNGIGVDNGFNTPIFNTETNTGRSVYNRSFDTRLNIIITSENTMEVIVIYRIIQAMLISIFNDLQFAGFQNPKISGGDLQINPELVPQHIFFRGINLDFFYDIPAPSVFTNESFANLIVQGEAVNE